MNYFGIKEASDKQWKRFGKCSYVYIVRCDIRGKHTSRCCKPATVNIAGRLYCSIHAEGETGGSPVVIEATPDPAIARDDESWHDRPGLL